MDLISQKGLETDQTESGRFSDVKRSQESVATDSYSGKDNSMSTNVNLTGSCNGEMNQSPIPPTSPLPAFYSNSHSYVGHSYPFSLPRQYDQPEYSSRWRNA